MLAAQATTLQQFSADALLVVLIVINAALGWRTGVLRRVLSFAGLYAGVIAAFYTGNFFSGLVRKGDIFANAWSFLAVTTAVVIVFEVVGRIFDDRLHQIAAVTFDRTVGMLVGGAVGFFQASVIFMVALAVGAAPVSAGSTVPPQRDLPATAIRNANLAGAAVRAQPAVNAIFNPVFSTDLTTHLEEGTQAPSP